MTARRIIPVLVLIPAGVGDAAGRDDLTTCSATDIDELCVSPDGRQAVALVTETLLDENRFESDLYLVSVDGGSPPRRLTTARGSEGTPRFSHDGSVVAFLAGRGEPAQVRSLPVAGGEARVLTAHPTAIAGFDWAPDGARLLYVAEPVETADETGRRERGDDARVLGRQWRNQRLYIGPSTAPGARIGHPRSWAPGTRTLLHCGRSTAAADRADLYHWIPGDGGAARDSRPPRPDVEAVRFSRAREKLLVLCSGRRVRSRRHQGAEAPRGHLARVAVDHSNAPAGGSTCAAISRTRYGLPEVGEGAAADSIQPGSRRGRASASHRSPGLVTVGRSKASDRRRAGAARLPLGRAAAAQASWCARTADHDGSAWCGSIRSTPG
jgi:hypothetical protein